MNPTVEYGLDITATVAALEKRLGTDRYHAIGFPGATDIDFSPVTALANYLANNVGDPEIPGAEPRHTKDLEVEVIRKFSKLFGGAPSHWWGYVTSGSTESNLYGLYLARERFPSAIVYHSDAAHYSVYKAVRLLGLPTVVIPSTASGEIRYDALQAAVEKHLRRPAIVAATIGTTMTEAIDDPKLIEVALDRAGSTHRHVHVDAALSGIPLALADRWRSVVQLTDSRGPDSMCVSGHKFLATPLPCGAVLVRRDHLDRIRKPIDYIAGPDVTISGSRPGLSALQLWYALQVKGLSGHEARANAARDLAEYSVNRLRHIGWECWRHEHAMTVVLRTPPPAVLERWSLATESGWSHIVCMPGVRQAQVDHFVADVELAHRAQLRDAS